MVQAFSSVNLTSCARRYLVLCYVATFGMAQPALASPTPSNTGLTESSLSQETESPQYCPGGFPVDPSTTIESLGYQIELGSPSAWSRDRSNPPGYGRFVYEQSFFAPGYNDQGGREYEPYDAPWFNAAADSTIKNICKWVKNVFRCFRKEEPPVITPPPTKTPRQIERERVAACKAVGTGALANCISCACAKCETYAETWYNICMGNCIMTDENFNCVQDCLADRANATAGLDRAP
jgi:hypothetical protein